MYEKLLHIKNIMKIRMQAYNVSEELSLNLTVFFCIIFLMLSFGLSAEVNSSNSVDYPQQKSDLADSISKIICDSPGEIGVAVIVNSRDTVTVNDRSVYPMMSVFKLHQAIAMCDVLTQAGTSLDSIIAISRDSLDPHTWSPILKEHTEKNISLSLRELLRYALIQSDNNASNLMFKRFVDVKKTDSFIATIIPRKAFQIAFTEEEMSADHKRAYSNYTSPSGAAMLINRVFEDSLLSPDKQEFIKQTLGECITGQDRIIAPLKDKEGVAVAHKTGSGYTENGILAAHNDVAYVCLPDGTHYSLAVFVKDFAGNEKEASSVIARISQAAYEFLAR